MPNYISEDQIEKATIEILTNTYGYRSINCFTSEPDSINDRSSRTSKQDVVFRDILKTQVIKINPDIPPDAMEQAIEQLLSRRSSMSPVAANKEIYSLIRDGIKVQFDNSAGLTEHEFVKVIDFSNPENNDFCAVTQLWIKGDRYNLRPDIIIYINGLPLVFIELKNSNVKVQNAHDDNLTRYKKDIPLLFNYNAFCVLSNAVETKVGSFTAGYEHFFTWLRTEDEKEKVDRKSVQNQGTSLERVIHGIFPKEKLLDYIENFILFKDNLKVIAQNHQFIGVNKAIESFKQRDEKKGKLGVFWHTQGSGKSFSMIFLARKIFHKFTGNYTFVIVTDREDLDGQIYKNFLETNTVTKEEAARPKDSTELRNFLGRNMRLVFTLIHKFRFDKGKVYPLLSDRSDIIVIVDEAHRTQYASLAENMRQGLPNAQYFAFTGTPILGKGDNLYQGKTYDWFGGYVSQYSFEQSMDDGATVPIFYQKRLPEVLIQNENLSDEFYQILEDENQDEISQQKLEREYSTELQIIKRETRLETIAKDIVDHFPNRGYLGKGMVISIDKFTSVKMYDKVQKYWKEEIRRLVGQVSRTPESEQKRLLQKKLEYMRSVEMSVVISEEAGEEEKFAKQGLDIKPHRKKLAELDANGRDTEDRFKAPETKLQLVFVCSMWLTGFDAPTISTLYLDKPMKDHTLMQTIARANRVTSYTINGVSKANGEVVDYYNVFRNMKKALSNYGSGGEVQAQGSIESEAVQDKSQLFVLLDEAIIQGKAYCDSIEVNLENIISAETTFNKVNLFAKFAEKILEKDQYWKEFKVYENTISSLYEACKPEILGHNSRPQIEVFQYLRGVVESIIDQADISSVKKRISELLDDSIVTADDSVREPQYEYRIDKSNKILDLSKVDFDKLKDEFKHKEYKNIEIANLRAFLEKKLEDMLRENSTRVNFAERLQRVIDRYNSGGMNTENYYDELVNFAENIQSEDERHIREGLTKDELELFDILKKDKMTKEEEIKVKNAAKDLLIRLKDTQPKVLIQDWFKDSQSQNKVKSAIEDVLDQDLPRSYDINLFKEKSRKIFELVFEYASKGLKWAA